MKKNLAVLSILILAAALGVACSNSCDTGAICGDYNIVGPGPTPTITPQPSPGATPDPCRVEAVRVGFNAGAQMPYIALGATEQLDATPMNSSGEVPKGCNVAREPVWTDLTPAVCVHTGTGYNPFVRALRVGVCSVTATVANVSGQFSTEVR